MAERTVKVTLRSQVSEYVAGMEEAAKATRETGTAGEKLTQQREAFQQLGGAMVVVGGAITAVGLAALKTGIDYNSMQQSSRAALQTMLGSAEAVNVQMDKLDAFAKGSPFSKATFIQAQQQMLAFGIETQKVIPYLDAVQNAVAAAGGSNDDIAGIVATMSKIQSSAKITAQDLNEFGNRGVNAAELIGSQMGMTGAEIRTAITSGSLDATEALDALAAGMSTKFAGAADNVKETFAGAMDRVKAAWRDFGSELAKPLVDPEGGGALIDFLNGIADAMRGFEKLPEPVKVAISLVTGLAGAALLAGGTMLLAVPKVVEFRNALTTLGVPVGQLDGVMRGLGKAVGIAAAAWALAAAAQASYEASMRSGVKSQGELVNAITTSTDAVDMLMAAGARSGWSEFWHGDGYTDTLANLGEMLDRTGGKANNFWAHAFTNTTNQDIAALDSLERMGKALAELSTTDLPKASSAFAELATAQDLSRDEMSELLNRMPAFKDALVEQATEMGVTATDANLLKIALGEIKPATDEGAEGAENQAAALEELQGVTRDVSEDVSKLADEIRNFGSTQFDVEKATIAFHDALATLDEQLAEGKGSLDVTTEAGRDTMKSMLDVASSTNDYAASVAAMGGSTEEIQAVLESGRQKIIDTRMALGDSEEAARTYADQLISTPEVVKTRVEIDTNTATSHYENWLASVSGRLLPVHINYVDPGAPGPQSFYKKSSENGNLFTREFANGGILPGTIGSGFYQGEVHKFAETSLPWEAYISPKPGQRERNIGIWQETGERLGVMQEIRNALGMQGGRGDTNINQTNYVTQVERDPRLVMRQFGRELKGAM